MKHRVLVTTLLAVGVASLALGQTPDSRQSASPTSNQYRLRIIEPMEGATVTGSTVNIVIAPQTAAPTGTSVIPAERADALRPTLQIWVDGKDYGNLPSDQNVFTASTLTPGPHTVVIAAKNNAGELIDRKELKFTSVESATADVPAAPVESTTMTSEASPQAAPAEPPASSPAVSNEATSNPSTSERETLPATATAHPTAALGGLALVGLGLALLRRRGLNA